MSLLNRFLNWGGEPTKHRIETESPLFDQQVSDFWSGLAGSSGANNSTLINRVWVANRCQQMNSNAISTMPVRHFGTTREPAWVANPDPVWFPNGIGDAIFAIVWSLYGFGDAFVYITSRYADGYPSGWTVLDANNMTVEMRNGRRAYRLGQKPLNPDNMVQISRDPRGGLRGTSAIQSYAPYTNGLLAAADLGRVMTASTAPTVALKSQRKLNAEQAAALQDQWMTATAARRGAPPVLPPELDFEKIGMSVADLMLLDVQQFDAQVIASAYGVPASLLNMPIESGLNYQTPVLLLEQWWRDELRPTAFRVSRAISAQMLPRGSWIEFDARDFLAPTWKELAETWVSLVEKGVASVEEARTVVLQLTQSADLADLATPPSAGASPAQQPSSVVALRPNQAVSP